MNDDREPLHPVEHSNPNAGGPDRLAGGMGVSSEREAMPADSPEGTGTRGSAVGHTTGTGASVDVDAATEERREAERRDAERREAKLMSDGTED